VSSAQTSSTTCNVVWMISYKAWFLSGKRLFRGYTWGMSSAEIIAQLPKLTHKERRAVARRIIELENEAQLLADSDRRADANFKMLDVMEAEDDGSRCQSQ